MVPPCVAVCPQARGISRENVRTAAPLVRIPRSRAQAGRPAPFVPEENGAPCVQDLGYGNNTVPQEFAGERPACRRAPNPERGTRCATKPNTMRTHGIPSQPSVSRGRGGNGPKRPASSLGHLASMTPGSMSWPGSAATCPAGRIGRSFPASAAQRGLRAKDTRTMPLDV